MCNNLLVVYPALPIGGVETFFLRLASFRKKQGLQTTFLLLYRSKYTSQTLLQEIKLVSTVVYWSALTKSTLAANDYFLLQPLSACSLRKKFGSVDHIHVASTYAALISFSKILPFCQRNCKLTIGAYHSKELFPKIFPFYHRYVDRYFLKKVLSDRSIFAFSPTTANFYCSILPFPEKFSSFRIGVVDDISANFTKSNYNNNKTLKICSVGRLADFKSYNLWMPHVIRSLKNSGYDIIYDIYGNGDKYNEISALISDLALVDQIYLKGSVEFSQLSTVLSGYDLFIGSGTSIIHASCQGIPSIIGIESHNYPSTYGWFSDFAHDSYNRSDLPYPKTLVENMIKEFINMKPSEKSDLSLAHMKISSAFYMSKCSDNFNSIDCPPATQFYYSRAFYELSRLFDKICWTFVRTITKRSKRL